ncbi:MAG: LPS assembly lipoprotein LptE [Salinarimonas sp.]
MSSSSLGILRRTALIGLASFALGGCFTPLYGPTAAMPDGVSEALKTIEVGDVSVAGASDAMIHALRSDLIFALDGERRNRPESRFRLSVSTNVQVTTPIISTITGRAASSTLQATASWRIEDITEERIVLRGRQQAAASYDRTDQRFASVRARRDAELRLARQLSDAIATRIALDFRTGRHLSQDDPRS